MGNELTSREPRELSSDINVITAEINAYQQVAGEAIFEIGRRLHHVRYNPKEYGLPEGKDKHGNTIVARGAWGEWLEEVNIPHDNANKMMRIFEEIGEGKSCTYMNKGLRALYEIATLPPEHRDVPHELPTGETKKPEEMTVRELRELKRKLKQAEQIAELERKERERLEQEYAELTDDEIEMLRKENESLRRINEINERRAKEGDRLKEELERLGTTKDDYGRAINAATELSGLVVKIEHLLKDELAPIKYSRAMTEQRDNEIVQRNLEEIVGIVRAWCDEMDSYLNKNNYIDVEVINYE